MNDAPQQDTGDQYWANLEPREMPEVISERFKRYLKTIEDKGRTVMYRSAVQLYFGKDGRGGYVTSHFVSNNGQQGETTETRSNHFRSLVRRMHTMITEQRPEFEVSAVNDSGDSMSQVTLAKMLLDYYMDEGRMEQSARLACERALVVAEAWIHQWWDVDIGEVLMTTPEGQVMRAGDIRTEPVSPWDCAFDLDIPQGTDPPWVIIRRPFNKWDLAAKHPEIAGDLVDLSVQHGLANELWKVENTNTQRDSDYLKCLFFYHDRTPAVPNGRMMIICGEYVLFDGPLPYERIPAYRIAPCEEFDTNGGYSDSWDVMGLQQIYDSIVGGMFSVHDAYALPNMLVDKGSNLSVKQLSGGLRKVEWDSKGGQLNPPEPMKFPQIPDAHFKLRDLVRQDMEINFGMNAIARGEATSEVESGAHAALIDSKAIQYASGLVYAYVKLIRQLAYGAIRLLQTFATEPRNIAIIGQDNEPLYRAFSSENISLVRQIRVEMGSAMMRTFAQRDQTAKELVELFEGQITIEQYLAFRIHGRLEPLYKHQRSEVMNIRRENERMARGEETKVMVLDHHMLHIREHSCLLHNPDLRFDDAKSMPILQHVQEHIRQLTILQMANPGLLIATGQMVPEMPLPPQQAPGGPGAPPGGPPSGPGDGGVGKKPQKSDGGAEAPKGGARAAPPGVPDNSNLPMMPTNPGTGQQTSPNGGRT